MADKTLASLTAATPATGGLLYGTQGGADRKFTLSAAGAALMEAADLEVTVNELNYSAGVTSPIQEQLANVGDGIASANSTISALSSVVGGKQDAEYLGEDVATAIHNSTVKTTLANGDEMLLCDSASSYGRKKSTWSNIVANLAGSFSNLAHANRHKSGGADAVKLDELAAPTDVTTLNATTSAHGLLPKLGGGTTNFLRADGAYNDPLRPASALAQVNLGTAHTIPWLNADVSTTGSGGGQFTLGGCIPNTGSSAGSTVKALGPSPSGWVPFWTAPLTTPLSSARWTKPFIMSFSFFQISGSTNGAGWFKFDQNYYGTRDLANRGVGIKITNRTVVGIYHDGTAGGSTGTLFTTTDESLYQIAIASDGAGNITWLVNGTVAATTTSGPSTLETTPYLNSGCWIVEAANNTDASNTIFGIGAVSVKWDQ